MATLAAASIGTAMLTHRTDLMKVALGLTKNPDTAEDLVQETFERALRYTAQFEAETNLGAWLCTILRNAYFTQCRRAKARDRILAQHWHPERMTAPAQEDAHFIAEVRSALRHFPPDQRDALLSIAAGYSYEETAVLLGCADGTVKSRTGRARARLHRELAPDGPEATFHYPHIAAVVNG